MYLGMESMYESSKQLLDYCTKYYGYNAFILDEVDETLVKQLKDAILNEDRVKAVQTYFKLDSQIDLIRSEYCYNSTDRPYKSNFRAIAKDLYKELKDTWLIYNKEISYIAFLLRWISSSSYLQIREFLIKYSRSMFMYRGIPLDPDDYYCQYIPLEALMNYCVKVSCYYIKNMNNM